MCCGEQAQVGYRRAGAIPATAGDGEFVFSRQFSFQLGREQKFGQACRVRRDVKRFVRADARVGTGGDISDRVAGGVSIAQPGVKEFGQGG